jgi:hypothetical protein
VNDRFHPGHFAAIFRQNAPQIGLNCTTQHPNPPLTGAATAARVNSARFVVARAWT